MVSWWIGVLRGDQPPPEFYARAGFVLADAAVAVASAVIWWTARRRDASPSRLLTLVLV